MEVYLYSKLIVDQDDDDDDDDNVRFVRSLLTNSKLSRGCMMVYVHVYVLAGRTCIDHEEGWFICSWNSGRCCSWTHMVMMRAPGLGAGGAPMTATAMNGW